MARKPQGRPSRPRTLDGRAEARLIALACSAPPEGRKEWTMQLLAATYPYLDARGLSFAVLPDDLEVEEFEDELRRRDMLR